MLKQALKVPADHPWVRVFDDAQIEAAVTALSSVLQRCDPSLYEPPAAKLLDSLLAMLAGRVPPCGAAIASDGVPANFQVDFRYILYAGWIFWWALNRKRFKVDLSIMEKGRLFLQVNRLCEQALIQQQAINLSLKKAFAPEPPQ